MRSKLLYICWYPRDILGTSCIFTLRETLAIGKNLDLVLYTGYFPSGSAVKTLPAMQEMRVRSLGLEDPLEEGMATHSSILAWKTLGRGAWRAVAHLSGAGEAIAVAVFTAPSPLGVDRGLRSRAHAQSCPILYNPNNITCCRNEL